MSRLIDADELEAEFAGRPPAGAAGGGDAR